MRKVISVIVLALFIVGCQSKNSVLNLYSYTATPKMSSVSKSVFIDSVRDSRDSKNLVGTIKANDGSIKEYVILDNDLSAWVEDAVTKELNSRGVRVETNPQASVDAVVGLDIKDFSAVLEGFDKENLRGNAAIDISIKKGKDTITKQVSQKQSEFVVLKGGSAFSPFMQTMLNDIVVKTAQNITNSI